MLFLDAAHAFVLGVGVMSLFGVGHRLWKIHTGTRAEGNRCNSYRQNFRKRFSAIVGRKGYCTSAILPLHCWVRAGSGMKPLLEGLQCF